MNWRIQLEGDKDDLLDLSKLFVSSELSFKQIDGTFYMFSNSFDSLNDSGPVEEKGKEFLLIINAGLKLSPNYIRDIKISGVDLLNSDGSLNKHYVHLASKIIGRTKVRGKISKEGEPATDDNPLKSLLKWHQLAQTDPWVASAFSLISYDFDTWFSLFKLLEILEEDAFAPVMRKGKYRKEADRFSQTAQSYAALELSARHIKQKYTPPAKSMTLNEAKSFIQMLLNEWLASK